MKKMPILISLFSFVIISFPLTNAIALTSSWDGSTSNSWGVADNWSAGTPGSGDTAKFDSTSDSGNIIDLGAGVVINTIEFSSVGCGDYEVGSGIVGSQSLTLNNGGAITAVSGTDSRSKINANLTLGTDATVQTYTLTNASQTGIGLTITGNIVGGSTGVAGVKTLVVTGSGLGGEPYPETVISGSISNGGATAVALTKEGDNTLTLSGINTYTGTTTINAGKVELSGGAAIADTGAVVLADAAGVILQLDSSERIGSLSGGGGTGGEVNLQANTLTVGDASDTTYSGVISGTGGSLIKVGSGRLDLGGVNTYTGTTTISEGVIRATIPDALGTSAGGTIVQNGAALEMSGGGFTIANESLTLNGTGIANGGALRNIGGGNTWTGGVTLASASRINSDAGNLNLNGGIVGSTSGLDLAMGGAGDIILNGGIDNNIRNFTKDGVGTVVFVSTSSYTGSTTITDGTLRLVGGDSSPSTSAFIVNGTLDVYGVDHTIGSLAGVGTITSAAAAPSTSILTCGGDDTSTTFSGLIEDGTDTVGLTKTGSGTLTLSSGNTYAGATLISEGVLRIENGLALGDATGGVTVADGAALEIGGSAAAISDETLTLNGTGISNGGALRIVIDNSGWDGNIVLGSASRINTDTGTAQFFSVAGSLNNAGFDITIGGAGDSYFNGAITGSGDLIKDGAGKLILNGTNTYTGATTINNGNMDINASGLLPSSTAVTLASGVTLTFFNSIDNTIGSLAGGGTVTSGFDMVLTAGGDNTSTTFSGVIDNAGGAISLVKDGTGNFTMSGANTYSGTTTISAGTLTVANSNALSSGAVTNNSILDLGTTDLSLGSTYDQAGKLKLSVTSASDYGNITSTGASTITGSTIDVTVNGYLANNTTLDIVTASSVTYNTTTVNALGNPHYSLTASNSGTVLTLTVNRTANGFASAALNPNQVNVGTVLDNVTNPTSDMTTVLNALDALTNSQVAQALNTMLPDVSGATLQVSQATLDQLTQAILGHQSYLRSSHTGVSTGSDMLKGLDIWAQGYGSYLHQDPRQLSQGYNASVWGTALGFDIPSYTDIRVGTCFGFAQDYIRGKDNSNRTDVNAYQWTVYGEYSKDALYIDLSGAFALNTYDGSRKVYVGPGISRTASSDYNGYQYQLYTEAGYTIGYKKLNITPLGSFQYQHLSLDRYTETGAGALNLTVKSQDYDLAQTGLGIKLDYPLDTKYGTLVPEVRVKWLYDWVGDSQATTSSFTGGGASFATNGFSPAQSSWDFGTKITMFTKSNVTVAINYDLEVKDDYYGHYGYANVKYSF